MIKEKGFTVLTKTKEYLILGISLLIVTIINFTSIKLAKNADLPIIKIIWADLFAYTFYFAQVFSSIIIYFFILPRFFDLIKWKKILVLETMKTFENKLTNHFKRIHRSYIINLDYLTSIDGNSVHLHQKMLPIGETYRKEMKDFS